MNEHTFSAPYMASEAPAEQRAQFIRRTYLHLAAAILFFTALEVALFKSGVADSIINLLRGGKYMPLVVLGLFIGVSWVANWWARSDTSPALQYAGLTLYIIADAIIFVPLLWIAQNFSGPSVLPMAALFTLLLFGGLTLSALMTRKNFSFLGPIVSIASLIALGVAVASMIFGFNLGILFSAVMVAIAAASILHTTSNIIHEYRPDQHVAASLALFAAVALMFYYILRILIELSGRR
ncbi:MAG: permease [Verrucomicrobia bacterium]|jgi:FtsH-binding integral membrane protein|nr:permease [Verrucomicrobiota bacterium]